MKELFVKKITVGNPNDLALPEVFVLHGIGSDEESLVPFVKDLNVPGHYYFIRGPFRYGPNGFACFEVNFTANGPVHNQNQALESMELIKSWIDNQIESGTVNKEAQIVFMGFSQGAIMSYAMAMKFPDLVDKVIGLNGRVLKEIIAAKPINQNKKIKINALYGLQDEIQPMHFAYEAKERLNLPWFDLNYHEANCAHEVTAESKAFTKAALLN